MSIAATMLSPTAFTVATDLTDEFAVGVRVRADCGTDGIKLGTVTASSHDSATSLTTVTLSLDAGSLTANLAGVTHGNDTPDSLPRATAERFGAVRLATAAEAVAGADAAKPLTAAGTRQALLSCLRDSCGLFPGLIPPSLNLFCGSATDDTAPLGSFARSTTATRLGPTGLVETVTAGCLRREWGADGMLRGWRIEAAGTNLASYSEQLENAAWTRYYCSIATNATAAPSGGVTAEKIVEDTTAGASHGVATSITASSGTAYTISVYVKAAGRSLVAIRTYGAAAPVVGAASSFDLANGVTGNVAASHGAGITPAGDGWYRIQLTVTAAASDTLQFRLLAMTGASTFTYTGDGASGLYVWGAQIEAGSCPTSYIPTTTAVVRAADVWAIPATTDWFVAAAGTLFVAGWTGAVAPVSGAVQVLAQYDDGTASNRLRLARDAQRTLRCTVTAAGSTIADLDLGVVADLAALRVACAWSASGLAVCRDASAVTTSAVTMPTGLTTHRIGSDAAGASQWNGHVLHDAHFPVALSATRLQAITL